MAHWYIHLVCGRILHLGSVVAATEEEAIATAVTAFNVQPFHQNRITACKLSERDDENQQAEPRRLDCSSVPSADNV
jgi:hypothetical protein